MSNHIVRRGMPKKMKIINVDRQQRMQLIYEEDLVMIIMIGLRAAQIRNIPSVLHLKFIAQRAATLKASRTAS